MRNHDEKSNAVRTAGFHVFCFDLHSEPQYESGGWLLAVERFPAVSVHAADFVDNRKMQKGDKTVFREIHTEPVSWLLWRTVGFGLFYAPMCLASCYGESRFVAAT